MRPSLRLFLLCSLAAALGATAHAQVRLDITVPSAPAVPGEQIEFEIAVSNSGPTLSNVTVMGVLPQSIDQFDEPLDVDCAGASCNAGDTFEWFVGTLPTGATQSVRLDTYTSLGTTGGSTLSMFATTAGVVTSIDVPVVPSLAPRVHVAPDPGPAVPGQPVTLRVAFSNPSASTLPDLRVTLPVPPGTAFQSATAGGGLVGNAVVWALGAVPTGTGGRVEATFTVDAAPTIPVLRVEAQADPGGGGVAARSEALTPMEPSAPLRVTLTPNRRAATPGQAVIYQVTATNAGTVSQTGVVALGRLPEGINQFDEPSNVDCAGASCNPGDIFAWTVGTLAAGASTTVFFPTQVVNNPRLGSLQVTRALFYSNSLRPAATATDVLIGMDLNVADEPGAPSDGLRVAAWPQPFADDLTLSVTLPAPENARLDVFDGLGRRVATVFEGPLPAGESELRWQPTALAPGVYLYRLQTGDAVRTGRLVRTR